MNIIKPAVELWQQDADWIHHVAKCARICYASDGSNDVKLVDNLLKLDHLSMFRHRSIYYIIPKDSKYIDLVTRLEFSPYVEYLIGSEAIYLATNGHFYIEHKDNILKTFEPFIVTAEEFINWELGWRLMRYTFKVTTQISTSRELNRVSPNNIAEQSTRYVYENGTICCPHWMNDYSISKTINGKYLCYKNGEEDKGVVLDYIQGCDEQFNRYKRLVDNGMQRQDARGVLPLDTATICAYTYSVSQWRDIIDLRYHGKTGAPHPNAKIIAGMIREELIKFGYDF
jgi:thymidylate synthase (FAD)